MKHNWVAAKGVSNITMKERRTISSRLLTMEEAGVYLKIPLDTLYKMVSQGRIPVVKLNRHNRFDPVMLEEWIKKNTKVKIKGDFSCN